MTKTTVLLWFCAVLSTLSSSGALPFLSHRWDATVKVVDENGRPVSGAHVMIGYYVPPPKDESIAVAKEDGLTDTNGIFRASRRARSYELMFTARKTGYYESHTNHVLGSRYDPVKWSPTSTLVLKKIVQPIAMYAKRVNGQRDRNRKDPYLPDVDKPVGYDLNVGDWIAPYGKGSRADMFFTAHFDQRAKDDWNHKLVLTFPNPGDGIQPFTIRKGEETSVFRSAYEAPDSGYQPTWVKTRGQRPGEVFKLDYNKDLKFFIRVRTVLDEQGNVKSAHYGKIHGDFIGFDYYLNPTPNSRNVEFDPKKNLLKHKDPTEDVVEP